MYTERRFRPRGSASKYTSGVVVFQQFDLTALLKVNVYDTDYCDEWLTRKSK